MCLHNIFDRCYIPLLLQKKRRELLGGFLLESYWGAFLGNLFLEYSFTRRNRSWLAFALKTWGPLFTPIFSLIESKLFFRFRISNIHFRLRDWATHRRLREAPLILWTWCHMLPCLDLYHGITIQWGPFHFSLIWIMVIYSFILNMWWWLLQLVLLWQVKLELGESRGWLIGGGRWQDRIDWSYWSLRVWGLMVIRSAMVFIYQLIVLRVLHSNDWMDTWLLGAFFDKLLRIYQNPSMLVFPAHLRDLCLRELCMSRCSHWCLHALILLEFLVSQSSHALYCYTRET